MAFPLKTKHFIDTRIKQRIQQVLLRSTVQTLHGLKVFFVYVGITLRIIIYVPLRYIVRAVFRHMLVPMYKTYRKLKKFFIAIIEPLKKSLLYPFVHRHIATVIFFVIVGLIMINNFSLHGAQAESLGSKSLIAQLNGSSEYEADIVVTGVPVATKHLFASIATPSMASGIDSLQVDTSAKTGQVVTTTNTTEVSQGPADVITYTVQGGDTISTIADRFGISTNSVLWANGLTEFNLIKPGQTLKIPPVSGVIYQVAKGDTVTNIARKYNVSDDVILQYNRLADASLITNGQTLVIPGGTPPAPPPTPTTSTRGTSGQIKGTRPADTLTSTAPPSARPQSGVDFMWPSASHKINQYFLGYRHTGLDIGAQYGTAIYAAANGIVEKVQYQNVGYGYHVIIRHPDGTESLYGHASKIFVSAGQAIKQGQAIALVGLTGRTTGPHIHFEIIIHGVKVNPLPYIR